MIELTLKPIRGHEAFVITSLSKKQDVLTINGLDFDFTELPENTVILAPDIEAPFDCIDRASRVGGVVYITMFYPYTADADPEKLVNKVVPVSTGGAIALPV